MKQPTSSWKSRKCNLWLHFFAALAVFGSDDGKCGIPLCFWLGVYFTMLMFETWLMEMRERMADSNYWHTRRTLRKWLTNGTIIAKELFDLGWIIYGSTLYWSKDADSCTNESNGFITIMFLFILMGFFKLLIFALVLFILIYIMI